MEYIVYVEEKLPYIRGLFLFTWSTAYMLFPPVARLERQTLRLTPAFSGRASGSGGRISGLLRALRCNGLLGAPWVKGIHFYSVVSFTNLSRENPTQ